MPKLPAIPPFIETLKTSHPKKIFSLNVDYLLHHKITETVLKEYATNKNCKRIIIDTRPMGTGKTELMIEISKLFKNRDSNTKQIFIAHRRSLIADACKKFSFKNYLNEDFDDNFMDKHMDELKYIPIDNHDNIETNFNPEEVPLATEYDESFYIDTDDDDFDFEPKSKPKIQPKTIDPNINNNSIGVCINSIIKYRVLEYFINGNTGILFIDEIRQVIESILDGTVTTEIRLQVFQYLIKCINAAKYIHCADAGIDQNTIECLIKLIPNCEILFIVGQKSKFDITRTINIPKNKTYNLHYDTFKLYEKVTYHTSNLWITTDNKKWAIRLGEYLQEANITDFILVHGENSLDDAQREFLENPNEQSKKYRIVISTPVISSGVSIINPDFDVVLAVFNNIIAPSHMMQAICRVRNATQIECYFSGLMPWWTCSDKQIEHNNPPIITGELKNHKMFGKSLQDYNESTINQLKYDSQTNRNLEDMIDIKKSYLTEYKINMQDFSNAFLKLADIAGYNVNFDQWNINHNISGWSNEKSKDKKRTVLVKRELIGKSKQKYHRVKFTDGKWKMVKPKNIDRIIKEQKDLGHNIKWY